MQLSMIRTKVPNRACNHLLQTFQLNCLTSVNMLLLILYMPFLLAHKMIRFQGTKGLSYERSSTRPSEFGNWMVTESFERELNYFDTVAHCAHHCTKLDGK